MHGRTTDFVNDTIKTGKSNHICCMTIYNINAGLGGSLHHQLTEQPARLRQLLRKGRLLAAI
jgi:hypothetical protein